MHRVPRVSTSKGLPEHQLSDRAAAVARCDESWWVLARRDALEH